MKKLNLVLGSQLWQQKICLFLKQVQYRMLGHDIANAVLLVTFTTGSGSPLVQFSVKLLPVEMIPFVTRPVWRPPNLIRTKVGFVLSQPGAIAVSQLLLLHDRHTWCAVL